MRIAVLAIVAVAFFPAQALAVKVAPMSGEVRVNTGQGFELIKIPTEVAPGTKIMVSPEGSAFITYAKDCVVAAASAAVTIVQDQPQCFDFPEPMHFSPAVVEADDQHGSQKTKIIKRKPKPPETADQCLWDHDLLIIGGLVVGGAVLAAAALSGNDHPASP